MNYGSAFLVNATIADGFSYRGNAGFINLSGAASLIHTTITGNRAVLLTGTQSAGLTNSAGATLVLQNSVVTGNISSAAFGSTSANNIDNQGTLLLLGGNIIGDEYTSEGAVQTSGFAPGDVLSGPAADNGGPVETVKLIANLSNPALESAAIVTETQLNWDIDGNGVIDAAPVVVDARGFARDVDIDQSGTTPDLGAFELQALPPEFEGDLADGAETVVLLENTATSTDSPVGTVVFDVDANDGDGGATDAGMTFALVSGNTDPDGDGTLAFAIDAATGVITVQDEGDLNLHRQSSFTLGVSATDTGVDYPTSSATVIVDIADVSETYIVTTDVLEAYDGGTLEEETADGAGLSLSEAIALANAGSAADLIEFDASLLGATLLLTNTRMTISEDLTIDGDIDNDGIADITLDGGQSTATTRQHFDITDGTTTLYGLNMTRGRAQGNNTGGIDVRAGASLNLYNSRLTSGFSYSGVAGIDNAGTTIIRNTQINDNFCYSGLGPRGIAGIRNRYVGVMLVVNSSLTGNSFRPSGFGYSAEQSGIVNYGYARLENVTIADGYSYAGHAGFNNKSGAIARLTHTTITGNQAVLFSGTQSAGIRNESQAVLGLTNSVVTGNSYKVSNTETPTNLTNQGNLNLVGGNIIGDEFSIDGVVQSSGFAPEDVIAGPAADNGGLVETVALNLTNTNPAIDAGDDSAGEATDARGYARFDNPDVANNGSNIADLGAYEAGEEQSLVVTTDQDVVDSQDGLTSLREALALANDPTAGDNADGDADNDASSVDHITFDPSLNGSTLILTQGELAITSDVTIDGDLDDDGAPDITIDATSASRVLSVMGGTSSLTGLTLTGGSDGVRGGGLILYGGAVLDVADSHITNNYGRVGGGIYAAQNSSLSLGNTRVTNNMAERLGGGIYMTRAVAQIVNSNISYNSGLVGGGLASYEGTVNISGTTVAHNTTQEDGGGLWHYGRSQSATMGITNSQIYNNTSTGGYGGGISIAGDTATASMHNSTVANNASLRSGGGLSILGTGLITLTNSSVLDNTSSYGGGLSISRSPVDMSGVRISGNSVSYDGGGINNIDAALSITGSTISGNTAGYDGGGIYTRTRFTPGLISNTTVSGNIAGRSGGGIANPRTNSAFLMTSSTVTGNYAPSAGGVRNGDTTGGSIISNSIIAGNFDLDSLSDPTANPDLEGAQGTGTGTNLIGHNSGFGVSDIFYQVDPVTGGGMLPGVQCRRPHVPAQRRV